MQTWVDINNEVYIHYPATSWKLCFQECVYHRENGKSEKGYRFIWRRPNGSLQPARGQARIPSKGDLEYLLKEAHKAGWY